jgi:molybdopterin converting factor small subunit
MDPDTSDWFIIEKEIGKETTIRDFLTDLAANNSGFRDVVFNPDEGTVGDQIAIVINQKLLDIPREMDIKLNDGDVITLLPVYAGG